MFSIHFICRIQFRPFYSVSVNICNLRILFAIRNVFIVQFSFCRQVYTSRCNALMLRHITCSIWFHVNKLTGWLTVYMYAYVQFRKNFYRWDSKGIWVKLFHSNFKIFEHSNDQMVKNLNWIISVNFQTYRKKRFSN